jgi:hypothetical protein
LIQTDLVSLSKEFLSCVYFNSSGSRALVSQPKELRNPSSPPSFPKPAGKKNITTPDTSDDQKALRGLAQMTKTQP